jgi:hypothetical protein
LADDAVEVLGQVDVTAWAAAGAKRTYMAPAKPPDGNYRIAEQYDGKSTAWQFDPAQDWHTGSIQPGIPILRPETIRGMRIPKDKMDVKIPNTLLAFMMRIQPEEKTVKVGEIELQAGPWMQAYQYQKIPKLESRSSMISLAQWGDIEKAAGHDFVMNALAGYMIQYLVSMPRSLIPHRYHLAWDIARAFGRAGYKVCTIVQAYPTEARAIWNAMVKQDARIRSFRDVKCDAKNGWMLLPFSAAMAESDEERDECIRVLREKKAAQGWELSEAVVTLISQQKTIDKATVDGLDM